MHNWRRQATSFASWWGSAIYWISGNRTEEDDRLENKYSNADAPDYGKGLMQFVSFDPDNFPKHRCSALRTKANEDHDNALVKLETHELRQLEP